ncbi:MAG: transglycosylase SLT domain-containing protein [Pseudomonadota bacterium]|nr:transglycosylase SLT domain-containing protein [Pseudomonadota bacterium]MDQ3228802.1 transglycosylase SLT domain-containing protein [Pseudomonadota bacterium]
MLVSVGGFTGRLVPFLVVCALVTFPGAASAQSKRDRAAAEALNQRMTVAETRYREALVKVGNNDPAGIAQSNAALEDMEDIVIACGKQKGCAVSNMLTTYKRLLKGTADGEGSDEIDTTLSSEDSGELPTGAVPQGANASELLSADGQRFVKMVQFNPAVQAGIRRWLTDMRVSLVQSHENYQYMRHLMSPAFQRNGLPEALLFGIMAKESNGKVHVGSRAGAVGPMQFMPATGKRFGLGVDGTGFDTRYDPRASADAAASYLNERFAALNNNIEMSLAAYNGGEGRAARVYRESGGRNFWDADVYNQFPPETKDYVPMVIAAAWLYLHPKEYGLTFPKVDSRPATLKLSRTATIYELTICLGSGGTRDGYMRVLRNLNPRYEPDSWIPAGATLNVTTKMVGLYNRHCIQGPRAELAKQLVMSDANSAIVRAGPLEMVEPPVSTFTPAAGAVQTTVASGVPVKAKTPTHHRVERGDTLVSIAQKYQCDIGALAKANNLKAPRYALRAEQRLKLEGCLQ